MTYKLVVGFIMHQTPVAERPDNFIRWISHYPSVLIFAVISVFALVTVNVHTLSTSS